MIWLASIATTSVITVGNSCKFYSSLLKMHLQCTLAAACTINYTTAKMQASNFICFFVVSDKRNTYSNCIRPASSSLQRFVVFTFAHVNHVTIISLSMSFQGG